jgi:hypothetical protein
MALGVHSLAQHTPHLVLYVSISDENLPNRKAQKKLKSLGQVLKVKCFAWKFFTKFINVWLDVDTNNTPGYFVQSPQ